MPLESLTVLGIFDQQDIEFDFSRSPYFIVGPNGTGKSTALKVLHNILTAQWSRLRTIPFTGIMYNVGDGAFLVEKHDLIIIERLKSEYIRRSRRPRKSALVLPHDWNIVLEVLSNRSHLATRRLPPVGSAMIEAIGAAYSVIMPLSNVVEQDSVGKVLYFPTYRRVERDLSELLHDGGSDPEQTAIFPEVIDRFDASGEVIGFGGQDISALLKAATERVNDAAREALNEHSVRFLQIIATGEKIDLKPAKSMISSQEKVDHLLGRIAAFAPLTIDLLSVKSAVDKMASKFAVKNKGRRSQHEDTLLVYLAALIALFEKIDGFATNLRKFAKLIESYLGPLKHAELQEINNQITITDANGFELSPDQLSSGEKQILAFFAFLLLKSDVSWKYIIIDEPELSLSVSWQKTLIADILDSKGSTKLIAATHSPFIFEKFSLDNVVALGDL